jgi:hypothetical protein
MIWRRCIRHPSDTCHGIIFPGIDVVSSHKSQFFGLPCQQIILDIAPVFLLDYVTDNINYQYHNQR